MSPEYSGPRIGELVVVHGPLARVVELAVRDSVPGAVVTDEQVEAWVPCEWLVRVHLRDRNGDGR
jgi:hypothetical protein